MTGRIAAPISPLVPMTAAVAGSAESPLRNSVDAATALIEGMKAADSTDPAKYLPAMQKVVFKGVTGNIAFDAKGDIKEGGISLYRYADGKWEPLK